MAQLQLQPQPQPSVVVRVVTCFGVSRGEFISHGSAGVVFTVNQDIVVKTASRFDSHPPGYAEEEEYSLRRIREESAVFDILAKEENWHPNIVRCFLHTSDYIFMERAQEDMYGHVTRNHPLSQHSIYTFLDGIMNAVCWLERLGIIHGDLRPPNILIGYKGQVKLCDFDNICRLGDYIQVGNDPYYEEKEPGDFGVADGRSEQAAIGCCAYFMSTGTEPEDRSYDTSHLSMLGVIIHKSWKKEYSSIKAMSEELMATISQETPAVSHSIQNVQEDISTARHEELVIQCRQYLSLNDLPSHPPRTDMSNLVQRSDPITFK